MKNTFAFPRPASRGNNYMTGEEDVVVDPQQGMTLRDYFAAKAMQAFITRETKFNPNLLMYAGAAYDVADAMLEARGE